MSKCISDKTKAKLKMGQGVGADYLPYITTSEFNSIGTTSVIKDWKTGRGVHCLSQGEALWYYILRWDDDNIDIREQFPLDNEITVNIAETYGIKHPQNRNHIMTTDFLVTKTDGSLHAYSVKPNKDLNDRTIELLFIEQTYWKIQNIPFKLLLKTDVNRILADNIRLITEYYQPEIVFDKYSALKHRIAIKEYIVDLSSTLITNEFLDKILEENV